MTISRRNFTENDFMKVRQFMIETYARQGLGYAWTLERLNFSRSLSRTMNGVDLDRWYREWSFWEEDGKIVAVANSEGEAKGEAHLQTIKPNLPDYVISEMFDFIENNLGYTKNGDRHLHLRISQKMEPFIKEAVSRGFIKQESRYESVSVLELKNFSSSLLLLGFYLKTGAEYSFNEKGNAHSLAFGYSETPFVQRAYAGYQLLEGEVDYYADFDCYLTDGSGEVISFATLWPDFDNKIAILEPVGTIEKFQGKGLGKALLQQVFQKAKTAGIERILVGSDDAFYQALGFKTAAIWPVWEKKL